MPRHVLLLTLALASCSESQVSDLRMRPEKGAVARYQETETTVITSMLEGEPVESVAEVVKLFELRVRDVAGNGDVTFELETTRVHGSLALPTNQTVTFDSEVEKEQPHEMLTLVAQAKTALTAGPLVLTVDPRGVLLSCKGADKLRAAIDKGSEKDNPPLARQRLVYADAFADAHMLETMQFFFVQLPEGVATEGTSWQPATGVHECGIDGVCHHLDTRSTVTSLGDAEITIDTTAALEFAPATEGLPRHGTEIVSTEIERRATLATPGMIPIAVTSESVMRTRQRNPMDGTVSEVTTTITSVLERLP